MKGLILMAEFCRQPLDPGFSGVPHGFWTIPVSRGAAMLLGWLHSHTDAYLEKLTCNVARRALRTSSIKSWLEELEKAGFVKVYWPASKGDRITVALLAEPWENLFGPRRNRRAEIGSPTAPKPAREGEQGEDQERTSSATASPKAKRSSFPEQWTPGEAEREAATNAGMAPEHRREQWDQFHDHHAAKGSMMVDWAAAWRTWCRNWRKFNPGLAGNAHATQPGAHAAHRDAGKVVYDGANNRFEIQHDGTRVLLATSDEVNAEFAATDWNDIS